MPNSVYDYVLKAISGADLKLSDFRGKKILLVNTASACGFTPQYAQMEELYENYKNKLAVIGLPCNDFGGQEPDSEKEIGQFCETNFHVSFPLTGKVKIKGQDVHPLYQFLTKKELNGYADSEVEWNFQKYLIDENGHLIGIFVPGVEPLSDEVIHAIERQ